MDQRRRIDRVTAPEYLDGLETWPIAELRTRRTETTEEESLLSYERRVIHGRIAILEAELDQRSGNATGSLVDRLSQILSDGTMGGSRGGANLTDPKILFDTPSRPTTKLAMDDTLTRLDELSDDEIRGKVEALRGAEREVSELRSAVQRVLDTLNEELGRRYASGDADPADILHS